MAKCLECLSFFPEGIEGAHNNHGNSEDGGLFLCSNNGNGNYGEKGVRGEAYMKFSLPGGSMNIFWNNTIKVHKISMTALSQNIESLFLQK